MGVSTVSNTCLESAEKNDFRSGGDVVENLRKQLNNKRRDITGDVEALAGNGAPHKPQQKPGVNYINLGQDDQMEIWGYRYCWIRSSFCWFFMVFTVGILRLVLHWMPRFHLIFTHAPCSLREATKVLLVEQYQNKYSNFIVKDVTTLSSEMDESQHGEEKTEGCWDEQALTELQSMENLPKLSLHLRGGVFQEVESIRMIKVKKRQYVWDSVTSSFELLRGLDHDVTVTCLHQQQGLSRQQQTMRRRIYGSNDISVPVQRILALLFLEVLNPFYVFQFLSFILWFSDDYYYYATAILVMSAGSVAMSVIQTRRNQINLHSTVHSRDVTTVQRLGGLNETVSTDELVPGDVLVVPPHGCILHCDAVLLSGTCIVNESMLTGESEPVTKTPLPHTPGLIYETREHSRHTLFCGTRLLQTRFYAREPVLAVVVRTGFLTNKGGLVRSILYPPPVDYRFERDSYRFVILLAVIASIGFLYTVVAKALRGVGWLEILVDALDLITIVVPPALPAAMTVGRMYAQSRLKQEQVFCISPRTINVAGSLDCVCFDKTGTLTEEGLDLWGVLPVTHGSFKAPIHGASSSDAQAKRAPHDLDELTLAMASAHSLTLIDGRLAGDPLDLKMFESTRWVLEEPAIDDNSKYDQMFPTVVQPPQPDILLSSQSAETEALPHQVGIVRQFPFSSSLQRMSVVVRALWEKKYRVFCKGAPEAVMPLCRQDTVPADFGWQLQRYTRQGLRVLALAGRHLNISAYHRVHRLAREEAESEMTLLGLLIMENRLKKDSANVVAGLRQSNVRCIMVTGDNMLTALSVARDCGLIAPCEKVAAVHVSPAQGTAPAKVLYSDCEAYDSLDAKHIGCNGDASSQIAPSAGGVRGERCLLAVTGQSWQALRISCPQSLGKVVTRGAVFARMSPEHKQQLVQELQALGYCVGMVGDGANDCGALKAAHVGISLSDAESSVASPFTSREASVNCVERVMREGRAALVTSFGLFKYMAAYSLTQFASVLLLYERDTNLSDMQFLFIDLFLITSVAFFFGRTASYPGPLAKSPPSASLFSPAPIVSLLSQLLLVISFQAIAFYMIQSYEWFYPYVHNEDSLACFENYAVFSVSTFQYLLLAAVFSQGAPYRQPLRSNIGLVVTLLLGFVASTYLILYPPKFLESIFEILLPPVWSPRLIILGMGVSQFFLSWFLELGITRWLGTYRGVKTKYEEIDKELSSLNSWPTISTEKPPSSPAQTPDIPSPKMEVHIHESMSRQNSTTSGGEVTLDPAMLMNNVQKTPTKDLSAC